MSLSQQRDAPVPSAALSPDTLAARRVVDMALAVAEQELKKAPPLPVTRAASDSVSEHLPVLMSEGSVEVIDVQVTKRPSVMPHHAVAVSVLAAPTVVTELAPQPPAAEHPRPTGDRAVRRRASVEDVNRFVKEAAAEQQRRSLMVPGEADAHVGAARARHAECHAHGAV
jgi:hypothetical protein